MLTKSYRNTVKFYYYENKGVICVLSQAKCHMNQFSIKDLENLTGIKAHTLRVWEQRYGIIKPQRKESNHRYYLNNDLKQLLRVSFLYHKGYKISKIATLNEVEIKQLSLEQNNSAPTEIIVNRLLEASIDFNVDGFETAIEQAFQQFGFEKSITQIIYPFLEKIGLFWMTDNVIPAQEHFSSNIIRNKIIAASDKLLKSQQAKATTVLLFTPPGEHHELPLLITNYMLRKNGIRTIYFGCNVVGSTIESYVKHFNVTHIYTHLITLFTDKDAAHFVTSLCHAFPNKQIVVSGPAVSALKLNMKQLTILHSFQETQEFCKTVH